jgi:hypothetical protein
MKEKKIVFKSADEQYYFCDVKDGELIKKVPISEDMAELITQLSSSISFIDSDEYFNS